MHEDGEVRCFSHDLQLEEWKTTVVPGANLRVEHALVLTIEQATQSLLKNREDILAMLGHDSAVPGTRLLFIVARAFSVPSGSEENYLCVQMYHMKFIGDSRQRLQELFSLILPEPRYSDAENFNYSWHSSSGTLFQNATSFYAVFDISGLVPRLANHMPFGKKKPLSCLRISPFLIALNTSRSISIIDIQYNSVQAEQILEVSSKPSSQPGKRKRAPVQEAEEARLLSYFAPVDLIVAIQGRKLVALQISTPTEHQNKHRKRKIGGLLVNSIGRGTYFEGKNKQNVLTRVPRYFGTPFPNPRDDWNATRGILESLFQKRNLEEFESVMAKQLGIVQGGEDTHQTGGGISQSAGGALPDLRKVHYLLSKLFSIERNKKPGEQDVVDQKLKIPWFPELLCHWLVRKGHFSADHIEISLKSSGSLLATERLKIGAYTEAVFECDPSLRTLHLILRNPVSLGAGEIVQVLRHLMDLSNQPEVPESMKLLTNGGEDQTDQSLESGDDNISPDSKLGDEKIVRAVLETILLRMNALSKSKVTRALKTELSAQELRSFVDLLRMELARSRWLSPYVEDRLEQPSKECHSDNNQVCVIANLLNCAIDGLGAGGWLLGSSITGDLSETAETIAYMKAEISAALEGIEEATYLKGMLGEILLYERTSLTSRAERHPILGPNHQPSQIQSISIDVAGLERSALPLGLKAPHQISTKKVGAGGELVERSRRDISRLMSKMVGKYSFDRITI